jgi:antitoxin MazE
MKLRISKWGNSLAVRLPAEYVRAIGAKPGDRIDAELGAAGKLTLAPSPSFDKAAFLKRVTKLRSSMQPTSTTVEVIRMDDRY